LRIDEPILCVVDGGKGIRKALVDVLGDLAVIQRCQLHKLRNRVQVSLGGESGISVMEATYLWNSNHFAHGGGLHRPRIGRISLERQVRPARMIVIKVVSKDSPHPQVPLAQDNHVVETLTTNRSDEPFDERVQIRASRWKFGCLETLRFDGQLS